MPTRQERGQFGNLEAFCGEPLNAVLIAHRRQIRSIVKDPRNDTCGVAFPPPSALWSFERMSSSLRSHLRRCKPLPEERNDLIACCDRRLTGLVEPFLAVPFLLLALLDFTWARRLPPSGS